MLPAILAAALLIPLALQAAAPLPTLLVVPARQMMIQLAFDMQSLRQADVVSWRTTTDPESPELNYWDGKNWQPLTLDQFQKGDRLARKPQKVIFMGLDIPASLVESPTLPAVARFETYDPAVLVNNLDAFYAFTAGEWRLLSKRYGFMLRDVNERVRQQNRYVRPPPPAETGPKRPPIRFDKNPPPAEVITPKKASALVAPKPAPAAEIVTPVPVSQPAPAAVLAPAPAP